VRQAATLCLPVHAARWGGGRVEASHSVWLRVIYKGSGIRLILGGGTKCSACRRARAVLFVPQRVVVGGPKLATQSESQRSTALSGSRMVAASRGGDAVLQ
jgi:hypothetical protein